MTHTPASTALALTATNTGPVNAPSAPALPNAPCRDGAADFDFLLGDWIVRNRRLRERLTGCTEWLEFTARSSERRILNGLGVEEEYRTEFWPGFVGMALRLYNPQTRLWSIYWADSIRGVMEAPVVGAFSGDNGVFEGSDVVNGRPIRVRFVWSDTGTDTPRWEQAFSADDGRSWETNWLMDFARPACPSPPSLPVFGAGWGDLASLALLR